MSSEVSFLVELYNPLYLFPIVAVVFTALMVYAFGFKSSTQPPTEVVDALNDKHHKNVKTTHETVKRRKPIQKVTTAKSEPKTPPNGHITTESNRPTEKKTPKKVAPEPTVTAVKTSGKNKKNKKNEETDVEVEDKNSGEWVEIISNKERKSRKQKEEQLLTLAKNEKNKEDKSKSKPVGSPKKSKPAKNEALNGGDNSSPKKSKETVEEAAKPTNESITTNKQNGVTPVEETFAERDVPDVYGLAKEQRPPKKTQKQKNTKRNSESEPNSKAESSPEKEPKPNINLSDKLTAAIVANYEANDNKADNASNKKKKEKKKKTSSETSDALNGKQTLLAHRNEENKASNGLVVEDSKPVIPTATEVKSPEEEEFKQVVNKKRRSRRE